MKQAGQDIEDTTNLMLAQVKKQNKTKKTILHVKCHLANRWNLPVS